jgi:uncharacterized protein YbaA (DUF1428 family)
MSYMDGYVVPVKTGRKQEYVDMATKMAKRFVEWGAIRVVEAWADDVPDGKVTDFKRSVAAEADETVVFSWVEWPSKSVRDAAYEKMRNDPDMQPSKDMPANMQRMIYGGFTTIVDQKK